MIIIEQREHQAEEIKNLYLYDEIEEAVELFDSLSDVENLIYKDSRGSSLRSKTMFYDRMLDEIDSNYGTTYFIGSVTTEFYTMRITYTENVNLTDKVVIGLMYE